MIFSVRIQQQQQKNQLQIADETQARATAAMEKLKKTLRSRDKTIADMTEQTKKLQEKNCRLSDEWSHMKSELNKGKESRSVQSRDQIIIGLLGLPINPKSDSFTSYSVLHFFLYSILGRVCNSDSFSDTCYEY